MFQRQGTRRIVTKVDFDSFSDTEQELGANSEHLQSASRGRVDPGVSFQAHHQSRIVLCLVPKKRIDY